MSTPASNSPGRVLVVDDSPLVRKLVATRLREAGYTVCEAANGVAALRMLHANGAYDAVVTDLRMPSMDGFALLEAVRNQGIETEVIVLTGSLADDSAAAVRALRLGATDFLTKDRPDDAVGAVTRTIERRRYRDQLREAESTYRRASEERFKALVENSSDGIALVGADGTFLYLSASTLLVLGYAPEELAGRVSFDFVHPDDLAATRLLFQNVLDQPGTPHRAAFRVLSKDGTWRHLETTLVNRLDNPSIRAIVANFRDATERKVLEDQLRQAQKMEAVGRLAGGVAHDFNNLLTAILGYTSLLLRKDLDDYVRPRIEQIQKAGEKATTLTSQLLAFSRKQVLQLKVLRLNDLVQDLEQMLRRLIGEDIQLLTITEEELGQVRADAGQLDQVLLNLAVNARDAMPTGGKLTIETANVELDAADAAEHAEMQPGAYVLLCVTDSGCGMDADARAHIFEPFFTTKEPGRGTGLGLSTVYGIVKQSGGHISVDSEPGKGTTFRIYLPRVEDAATTPTPSVDAARHGSESVLLVEDEPQVRELAREILSANGYVVIDAGSPQGALERVQSGPRIDLILADVVMPGMSGPELVKRLQASYPSAHVVFMSGYTNDAIVHHGALGGTAAFIQKPFTPNTLLRKLREVLDKNA
jgi:two-component system cell cycle sensor histidine kinase/response regulator CckA